VGGIPKFAANIDGLLSDRNGHDMESRYFLLMIIALLVTGCFHSSETRVEAKSQADCYGGSLPPLVETQTASTSEMTFSLDDTTCELPCWKGVTPQESGSKEVMNVLNEVQFVDQTNIQSGTTSDAEYLLWPITIPQDFEQRGLVWLKSDKVTYLDVPLNYALTLREVIDILGTPEGYRGFALTDRPVKCYGIALAWPDVGLLAFSNYLPENVSVESNTLVGKVQIFDSAHFPVESLRPWRDFRNLPDDLTGEERESPDSP
jgi:hypothetical protein